MSAGVAFIKSPAEFSFGDDINLFLEKFHSFAEATKCEAQGRFDLFKSYLDDRSFRRVQAIVFEAVHKTNDAVDMSKAEVKALIRGALLKEPQVPERISLKFKVQTENEEIEDFGDEIRLLGQKVHGKDRAETHEMVIEAFCAGVRDTALASKMLSKKFESLTDAINFAIARRETSNIKTVLNARRASSKTGNIALFPSGAREVEPADRGVERSVQRGASPSGPGSPNPGNMYNGREQRDNRRCFRCHAFGHIQRFCRASLASTPPRGASPGQIICFKCGDYGHIRPNCQSRGINNSLRNQNFHSRPGIRGQTFRGARPAQ